MTCGELVTVGTGRADVIHRPASATARRATSDVQCANWRTSIGLWVSAAPESVRESAVRHRSAPGPSMNRAFGGARTRRGAEGRRCGCDELRRRARRCTGAEWHGGNDGGLEKALESAVRHVAHPESGTNCALERRAGAGGERAGRHAGAGGARLSGRGAGAGGARARAGREVSGACVLSEAARAA